MLSLTDYITLKTRTHPRTLRMTGMQMTKGSCLCGKIRFEFTGEATKTVLCHCTNCKHTTGSAFTTNISIPSKSFRLLQGEPKEFEFDSGQGPIFKISFCGECSSTLWKESDAEGFKGFHLVQAGSLGEELNLYKPQGEIFTPFRSPWLEPLEGVRQFEGTDKGL